MKSLLIFLLLASSVSTYGLSLDQRLAKVINAYSLEPVECDRGDSGDVLEPEASIGKLLFTSKFLSGGNDTSCSTCHIEALSMTDGLSLSVGVSGHGEGLERMDSKGVLVPRNAFTLFGRSKPGYTTFFWDGKVQEEDSVIFSSIGNGYLLGFDSPLAVASIMPLLARDEFLGEHGIVFQSDDVAEVNTAYYQDQFWAANRVLQQKLSNNSEDVSELKRLLFASGRETLTLAEVGNFLARFIQSLDKPCLQTGWQRYLTGDLGALTQNQKRGALLFYGKGRCAVCHSGKLMSDFQFHSIGVPQGGFGPYIHGQDIGRAAVTFNLKDRYKFRTPPLLLVSKTSPYGHNGVFKDLESVVLFHINPISFLSDWSWSSDREFYKYGNVMSTRSELLGFIDISDDDQFSDLMDFIRSL
ncbi:His-Xaa-Ser system-associated MauG-like protein [Litoribrevibacter albus]|uniref:Methylamine utilization protein MauG n=1 Tax=Litoribrevibacter albus TaxID=1473156 RepID=A0AA37S8W6_9GAMM|nr:His-Xaa-Ser system-associated MauG-like protein [Litoribrevibacter albus]GLQ30743.1 methylamine utilization protein MauG [Litoribrevibacter albus]